MDPPTLGLLVSDPSQRVDVTPDFKTSRERPAGAVKRAPKKRRTDLAASGAWHQAVLHKRDAALWAAEDYETTIVGGETAVHLRPSAALHADFKCHHIVTRQECRKHGVPEWDSRNGVPVTKRRHDRHHSRIEPIHRSELPNEVYEFLAEYPVLWTYFNRMYPEQEAA